MDQNTVTLASILSDWLQTAIDNTLYSAVLVILTVITCGLVSFFGARNRLARLNAQSAKERDEMLSVQQQDAERIQSFERQHEQLSSRLKESEQQQSQILVEKKAEITELQVTLNAKTEFINELKKELEEGRVREQSDAERIAAFEQQLEQLSSRLQESEQLQSQQKQAVQQQSKMLAEKKVAITELQAALKDKTELFDQKQTELEEHKNKLSQHLSDQTRMAKMKLESSQFVDELDRVKQELQQLEVELNVKNEQIEQFEKASQSVADDKDRIVELEAQIEQLNSTRESKAVQDQVATLESQLIQLEQEKQAAESKFEHTTELENTLQEHNQQLLQFNEKLEPFLTQTPSGTQDDKLQAEDVWSKHLATINRAIDQLSAQSVDTGRPSTTIENDDNTATIEALKETVNGQQNYIDRLLYDLEIKKLLIKDKNIDIQDIPAAIIEKQQADQARIDALEQKLATKKIHKSPVDISEPLKDVTETMDHFQEKLKGFYHKFRS